MTRLFSPLLLALSSASLLFNTLPTNALAKTESPERASPIQIWHHDGQPAQLIELFTSEGCSSCPPADRYLSQFQRDPNLWSSVIPMAFHVDYWNYLGWRDRFSHPSFTQRQQLYRAYGATSSVYTPGFMVDGQEWRGYFSASKLPKREEEKRGKLRLTLTEDATADSAGLQGNVTFNLSYSGAGEYIAHLVLLALDEKTDVAAGENRGRGLEHDFIVLDKQQQLAALNWQFSLAAIPDNADAVAVWLTRKEGFRPVQTVAGYIK